MVAMDSTQYTFNNTFIVWPHGVPEWSVSKDSIHSGDGREQPASISRCTCPQTRGHPNHLGVSQEDQDRSMPPLSILPPPTSQNQCGLLPQEEGRTCKHRKEPLKATHQFSDMFQVKGYPYNVKGYSIERNTDVLHSWKTMNSRCWCFPTLKD